MKVKKKVVQMGLHGCYFWRSVEFEIHLFYCSIWPFGGHARSYTSRIPSPRQSFRAVGLMVCRISSICSWVQRFTSQRNQFRMYADLCGQFLKHIYLLHALSRPTTACQMELPKEHVNQAIPSNLIAGFSNII